MEAYREINRELTLTNQQLRQEVAKLKEEIVKLNRQLVTNSQTVQELNRRYYRFIVEITESCNKAVLQINRPLDNMSLNLSENELTPPSVGRQRKSLSRRSVRPIQPNVLSENDNDCDKENQSPAEKLNDGSPQISYVQTRRRKWATHETSDEVDPEARRRFSESAYEESEQCEEESTIVAGIVERDIPSMVIDENRPNNIPSVIIEENSRELSQLQATFRRNMQTTISEQSSGETLLENSSDNSNDGQENVCVQRGGRNLIAPPETTSDDTTFHHFQACSTPYKRIMERNVLQECSVSIRRLTDEEIARWTVKKCQLQTKSIKRSKLRAKNGMASLLHSPVDNMSKSEIDSRPRRHAAPISLREPGIGKKLRRSK